jgi:hypothetical protein
VLTKVKSHPLTPLIIQWISEAYRGAVLPIQIPDSRAVDNASAQFCTIYDTPTPDGTVEAYRRVRAPMDQLADYLYGQLTAHWR